MSSLVNQCEFRLSEFEAVSVVLIRTGATQTTDERDCLEPKIMMDFEGDT